MCFVYRSRFIEKYHPTHSVKRRAAALKRKGDLVKAFKSDLEAGNYDSVGYDEPPRTKESTEKETDEFQELLDKTPETQTPIQNLVLSALRTPCLIVKAIPVLFKREEMVSLFKDIDGFKYFEMTDPNPHKNMHRCGYVVFKDQASADAALALTKDLTVLFINSRLTSSPFLYLLLFILIKKLNLSQVLLELQKD